MQNTFRSVAVGLRIQLPPALACGSPFGDGEIAPLTVEAVGVGHLLNVWHNSLPWLPGPAVGRPGHGAARPHPWTRRGDGAATTALLEHLADVIGWTAGRFGDERPATIVSHPRMLL